MPLVEWGRGSYPSGTEILRPAFSQQRILMFFKTEAKRVEHRTTAKTLYAHACIKAAMSKVCNQPCTLTACTLYGLKHQDPDEFSARSQFSVYTGPLYGNASFELSAKGKLTCVGTGLVSAVHFNDFVLQGSLQLGGSTVLFETHQPDAESALHKGPRALHATPYLSRRVAESIERTVIQFRS